VQPLSSFTDKEEAKKHYIELRLLAPDEANDFVEENWEKTRG
jgi:hypothetical protein